MSDEFQVLRLAVVLDPPSGYGFVNGAARWQAINLGSYTATHIVELTRIAHVWGCSHETNVWKSSKISIFPLRIHFKLWWQHLEASQSLRPKYSEAHSFQFFCVGRLQNLLQVSSKCLIYSHEHVKHYDTFKQHTSTARNKSDVRMEGESTRSWSRWLPSPLLLLWIRMDDDWVASFWNQLVIVASESWWLREGIPCW